MKKLWTSLAAVALTVLGLGAVATMQATPAYAAASDAQQYLNDADPDNGDIDLNSTIGNIINFALGLIGLLCVVIIIIGGVNYATSQGDAGKVQKATRTLLYGVIGLVVCLLAFAIVNFVLNNIGI